MTSSTGEVDPSEGEGLWCWGWDGAYGIRGWGVVALGGTVGGGVLRSEIVVKDQKIESTRAQPPAARLGTRRPVPSGAEGSGRVFASF